MRKVMGLNRKLISMFKNGKTIPKIMKVIEEEKLNIAEAELIPLMLKEEIKKNSELHEKGKQFTVHEELFRS